MTSTTSYLPRPAATGLLALLLLGTSCSVFRHHRAEPAPTTETAATAPAPAAPLPPAAARDLADVMTDALQLTPDQTGKVRQILNTTVQDVNAARQQHPAGSAQLTNALTRINQASENQLRQVLGPTKYRELQAKRPQIQAEMQRR